MYAMSTYGFDAEIRRERTRVTATLCHPSAYVAQGLGQRANFLTYMCQLILHMKQSSDAHKKVPRMSVLH